MPSPSVSPDTGTCDLCGFSLKYGRVSSPSDQGELNFCCMGCRQVYRMLSEASGSPDPADFKNTDLFRRCREAGIIPASEDELADLHKPSPPAPFSQSPTNSPDESIAGHTLPCHLNIEGMWCPACAWAIEVALERMRGVESPTCNFSTDTLRCAYDPIKTSPAEIITVIQRLGYPAAVPGESTTARENRAERIRLGLSLVLTMNVMMLSVALYSGFFTELTAEAVRYISWPIAVMATAVYFYGGRIIHKRAVSGALTGAPGMETLISAGATCAFFYSLYNLLRGSIHLYFDTASMLITLVLIGKAIEARAKEAVRVDLSHFFSLRPAKVKICSAQWPRGRYVDADALSEGDHFQVETDEIVSADGVILDGAGTIDESSLTGEARPIAKKTGDRIKSGAKICQGTFTVRAERVGDDSILGRMVTVMEEALGRKTAMEGQTDRILRWFVPAVLSLAITTGISWCFAGLPKEAAVIRAVTVMVISCPCALGVAIPLARVAGISIAGKKGLLVRDFSAFEQADRIDSVVFDKTGTLTKGTWILNRVDAVNGLTEDAAIAMAAAIEKTSDHEVSRELRRQVSLRGLQLPKAIITETVRNGVSGHINGQDIRIGSLGYAGHEWNPTSVSSASENDLPQSSVYMSIDARPAAVFMFGDDIREGSLAAVKNLQAAGYETAVISGDGDETTRQVGMHLGIATARGDMLPGDKARFVEGIKQNGRQVAMMGDGVNDAPAMASANLAFAVYAEGNRVGRDAADVTLMKGDPGQALSFFTLARRVNAKIRQNLILSAVYNLISIPVAMAGWLTPLVAVCAMLLSSLSVTGNTLLLIKNERRRV